MKIENTDYNNIIIAIIKLLLISTLVILYDPVTFLYGDSTLHPVLQKWWWLVSQIHCNLSPWMPHI